MRIPRRSHAHFLVAVTLAVGLGALAASCGTDAVGIEACRQIELARCDEAPACQADFEVERCHELYRDQCLHGIENSSHPPSDAEISDCVGAIKEVGACTKEGAANMKDCPVALVESVLPATISPCDILLSNAHLLQKCSFAALPTDAGPAVTPDAAASDAGTDAAPPADASTGDASSDAG